ncbi:winged helix-turn-helix domain-containing protein [Dokdonella soli]|uniref:OmpR/PhoB-type domain-containing protein n=1 Tax=Dokdonella soli TaxID=529810 RepID=A0ABN1IBQ9_9GAMM
MNSEQYQFLGCSADTAARELRRDGKVVELSPKVFDCLIYLIENRERAVSRDELIAAVWGRANVSDTQLGQTVLKARRAIGDTSQEQPAIRTVRRFGYRWIAETSIETAHSPATAPVHKPALVPEVAAPAPPIPAATDDEMRLSEPPSPPPRRSSVARTGGVVAVTLAALAMTLAAIHAWRGDKPDRPGSPSQERTPEQAAVAERGASIPSQDGTVAVMPVSHSAGDDWFWLRLGLMDQIGRRLHLAGFAVVPSSNVVALTRALPQTATIPDTSVRAATGARYVVLPQAIRTATGWRVQLDVHEGDRSTRLVEGVGADVVVAADSATDRLLLALGKSPPHEQGSAMPTTDQLLQRADALLGSDFAGAKRVMDAVPPAQRELPAVRLVLARIEWRTGAFDLARTHLGALLREVPAERDPALRARALYALASIDVQEDRSADAEPLFSEALTLRLRDNQPAELGEIYTGLAGAFMNLGRYAQASDALARARVQLDLAGDTLALARVDANEGALDVVRGRPAEGLPLLQRAAECFRLFGAVTGRLLTVAAEVKAQLALLDPAGALVTADAIDAQFDQRDNAHIRATLGVQRARALAANGRIAEAIHLLDKLKTDVAQGKHAGLPGDIASTRAQLALAAGDAVTAEKEARIAVAALQTVDEQHERARAWRVLTRALQAGGHVDEATSQVREFSQWATTMQPASPPVLYAALAGAEHARDLHRTDEADKAYGAALEAAEHWDVPDDLAEVVESFGNALIKDGRLDLANQVIARIARWTDRDFACALLQARLYNAVGQRTGAENALARARSLAGERALPALLIDRPANVSRD